MNYEQTIAFLYEQLPMFSRIGTAAFKKDLTNTKLLCERLGNPEKKFKSIHVAGTNGKGSVSHMLSSVFQTAGYRTGLYTSPHLYDFGERIRINGDMIDQQFVIDFVETVKPWIAEIQPSFFEITVAMAFEYFAKQEVAIAIIEVGLGGRLDSTNVIIPELSVITNIGFDHMNLLGNTLEAIATEKAGIIKEQVPVVIGESVPETRAVFEKVASEKKAPIHFAEELYKTGSYNMDHTRIEVTYSHDDVPVVLRCDLPGIYQKKNMRTVLASMHALKDWNIDEQVVQTALSTVKSRTGLMGRWDVLQQQPTVVLEVAHNEDGIVQMLSHIEQLHFNGLHIVLGIVKDKDTASVLKHLPTNASYYFTQARIPRALDASELKNMATEYGLHGGSYSDVNEALLAALQNSERSDLIIVCGSIFLVAEVERERNGLLK